MIVADSSALIAVLEREPDWQSYIAALERNAKIYISAVTLLETAMVLQSRRGERGVLALQLLLQEYPFHIVSFDGYAQALAAFQLYGKGQHSKARLNLCDCIGYALAKDLGLPLLFKGDDFSATDISSAIMN